MTTHGDHVADEMRQLIASGHVSMDALVAITRIKPEKLEAWLGATTASPGMTTEEPGLTEDESMRVSRLVPLLTHVAEIDDDERLRAILESLTIECRLTLENISRLTEVDLEDLKQVLADPHELPAATKYSIALRASYLIGTVNLVRPN